MAVVKLLGDAYLHITPQGHERLTWKRRAKRLNTRDERTEKAMSEGLESERQKDWKTNVGRTKGLVSEGLKDEKIVRRSRQAERASSTVLPLLLNRCPFQQRQAPKDWAEKRTDRTLFRVNRLELALNQSEAQHLC